MRKSFVSTTHVESSQKKSSLLTTVRTAARSLVSRVTNRFEGTAKYTPFFALGAIATGYGILKGQGDAELFGSQLQALSTNILQGASAGNEAQMGESLTGMMYGLGSFALGVSTLVGTAARMSHRARSIDDDITTGTFVREAATAPAQEEGAAYTPRARHLGRVGNVSHYQAISPLRLVHSAEATPVPHPAHTTLDNLLSRAA